MATTSISFISPVDGDMLHAKDGEVINGSLETIVSVKAPKGSSISINGEVATAIEDIFIARLSFEKYKNSIEVVDNTTGEKKSITVYWLPDFANKYRLSIDDNIWFLRDLHKENPVSLFDNSYLAFLKNVHETYGTKIHLNLFYQTEGFDLSQLSDRYKPEWEANANWLRLSFHALGEFPDKPYINAGYDKVKEDCTLVDNQIKRFAGKASMGPFTTIHWGEATKEGVRAVRELGYNGLLGYFGLYDEIPGVSYYLQGEKRNRVEKRFVWKDDETDMVFVRTSVVIDREKIDTIVPLLEKYKTDNNMPPYLDFLVHEQYYYPDYFNYQPDYREKIITAVQWAVDNGYKPAFLADCVFEK
jgi:hypothetical protein